MLLFELWLGVPPATAADAMRDDLSGRTDFCPGSGDDMNIYWQPLTWPEGVQATIQKGRIEVIKI